jgi:hypothetical protein
VYVQNKLGVSVRVDGSVRSDPIGGAGNMTDEDLALRRGQFAGVLDYRIYRAVADLGEVVRFPIIPGAGSEQRIESFLPFCIGLGSDMLPVGISESTKLINQPLAFCCLACAKDWQNDNLLAMDILRKKR